MSEIKFEPGSYVVSRNFPEFGRMRVVEQFAGQVTVRVDDAVCRAHADMLPSNTVSFWPEDLIQVETEAEVLEFTAEGIRRSPDFETSRQRFLRARRLYSMTPAERERHAELMEMLSHNIDYYKEHGRLPYKDMARVNGKGMYDNDKANPRRGR